MATSLKVRKGVLTRHANTLSQSLNKYSTLGDNVDLEDQRACREVLEEIQAAEVEIRALHATFEHALFAFTEAVDNLREPLTDEEDRKVSEYLGNAQDAISETTKLLVKLQINKETVASHRSSLTPQLSGSTAARIELPKIPLPEFSGKDWQWDSFWELFDATVHSLQLSDLQKFNYLLRALKGEARESVARFQVTSANYKLAVAHLKERYGNAQGIITNLHRQLEQWNARSTQLKDQRKLYDRLSAIIAQLASKGESLDSPWLLSKILSKFTEAIQRSTLKEKVSLAQNESWTMTKLMTTLDSVIKQEEEIERQMPTKVGSPRLPQSPLKKAGFQTNSRSPFCFYCDSKEHWSTDCTKITSPKARLEHLKKASRCIGCGSKAHNYAECNSKGCMKCGKKHHTSICFKSASQTPTPSRKKEDKQKPTHSRHNIAMCEEENEQESDQLPNLTVMRVEDASDRTRQGEIFLLTGAIQTLHPRTRKLITLQVLLDTGADRSFIDAGLAKELELTTHGVVTMKIKTFGAEKAKEIQCIDTCMNVWDFEGEQHILRLYTHDNLTGSFTGAKLQEEDLEFIRRMHIKLSSAHSRTPHRAGILIGCDQLWNFIKFEAPHFTMPSGLKLVPTRLGYMVSGERADKSTSPGKQLYSTVHTIESGEMTDLWESHWNTQTQTVEQEFCGPEKEEKARINEQVFKNFNESIEKREIGYVVRLPFKEQHENLPDNRALALHRLRSVFHKYQADTDVLRQYHEVFQEQLEKGILEQVDEAEDTFGKQKHYLPHQPVITPQKDTTKFRVVFDASAHYKNCPSLNDVVHQGPTLLPKLYGILLRFRIGKYVMLSDVEKAFLQVHLHEDDRDFTRCLWVKDITKPLASDNLIVYRFKRVTFGINASPFLLSATIQFHLSNYVEDKILATEIASNLYVDNLIVDANTVSEGIQKYKKLKAVFDDLKMNLRAFVTNNSEITKAIATSDRSANLAPKVLGIPWNSVNDNFSLHVNVPDSEFVSKRTIAQMIASVYDPFGWFLPLLVKAKHFQQTLWKEHYDWDEPLSDDHKQQWKCIVKDMSGFRKNLPRKVTLEATASYALVTYSDASGIAMTACTYLASDSTSNFLMAKSKVSDSKHPTTIPKMEMNAITLGARLTLNTLLSLKASVPITRVMFLTDSEIVLKWLQSSRCRDKTGPYVTNRVREVHRVTRVLTSMSIEVKFGYIDTKWNPADVGTRGVSLQEFTEHVWWEGYPLKSVLSDGFASGFFDLPQEQEQEEKDLLHAVQINVTKTDESRMEDILDLTRYSSKTKSLRILAYVIRFLRGITSRVNDSLKSKLCGAQPCLDNLIERSYLTATEIKSAHDVLIRNHQAVHVHPRYIKELSKSLNVKEDEKHLLHAYGRLNKSDLSEMAKNPILIGTNTEMSRLIVLEAHGNYHKSTGHTMAQVRQQYWIPRLREQVKKCIRSCIACQKMNNLPYKYPEMTDLPEHRVRKARPFQNIGLDYFGPITICNETREHREVYGCIFTCCVTRLIHLEVVSDGTTEKFLNAFRRFVARRGKPHSVTCDNAPTFVLGSQIMNESLGATMQDDDLTRAMSDHLIEWKHITPYSPWKGGFYERLIKSVKHALIKAAGRRILTMEQLCTFLVEIEGCLNGRPLTYQESDLNDDIVPLRPIDFLQSEMNLTLPLNFSEEDQVDPSYLPPSEASRIETRLQAQKALQSSYAITERFWEIWRNQYLTALREQHRRNIDDKRGNTKEVRKGEVVLLSDPLQKRNTWKMGRISKLVPSTDGAIREVEVYCNKKTLRRPVNQLIPLELPEKSNESEQRETPREQDHRSTSSLPNKRYNLRPRKTAECREQSSVHCFTSQRSSKPWPASLYLKMALALALMSVVRGRQSDQQEPQSMETSTYPAYAIECREHGVYLHAPQSEEYELCINSYCITGKSPPVHKLLHLPPEELLHNYDLRWKLRTGNSYTYVETSCPAQPFCSAIDCTICAANILNPECWPLAALTGLGITLYLFIAVCYTVCYVPITVGRPCRLILRGIFAGVLLVIKTLLGCSKRFIRILWRRSRPRSSRILQALAIIAMAYATLACQEVNIFPHQMKNCRSTGGKSICDVEVASVVKINPFKKEACLTFRKNDSTLVNARLRWQGLRLLCERASLMHTRNVQQRVVDSKRCPHMGSCIGNKCADINETSMLPELAIGNAFPGITHCIESCGGPGCDCFHLSSGCLFYRIYAVPKDDTVYELFRCIKWKEEVKLRLEVSEGSSLQAYVLDIHPNVPTRIKGLEVTLSVLSAPPLPVLDQTFITSGNYTAFWQERRVVLQCPSKGHAQSLQCTLHPVCECTPAESQVMCKCTDDEIEATFSRIENVLPLSRQQVHFSEHPRHGIVAKVGHDVSAEVILNMKETISDLTTEIKDDICTVANTHLIGCYKCSKGAKATVTCTSALSNTFAEIECGSDSFTVPCSTSGVTSQLDFLFGSARVQVQCIVRCGTATKQFEITGILKYVHNLQDGIMHYVQQDHNRTSQSIFSQISWPDISHIFDVYLQWYKSLILIILAVAGALFASYLYLSSACCRLITLCIKSILRAIFPICRSIGRILCWASTRISKSVYAKKYEKTAEKIL